MSDAISIDDLFDRRLDFPDIGASRRLARLVGIDQAKTRLAKILGVLVNPAGPRDWAEKHHKGAAIALDYLERRPPLVILAGDVGTGKTALSETVGDAVARQEKIGVTLYPLSLATRGSGKVGRHGRSCCRRHSMPRSLQQKNSSVRLEGRQAESSSLSMRRMPLRRAAKAPRCITRTGLASTLLSAALIDLPRSRPLPVAVVLRTNRLSAIDPAVQRRAAEIFDFDRPGEKQRRAVIEDPLTELGFQ